jgi:hypothetical protein
MGESGEGRRRGGREAGGGGRVSGEEVSLRPWRRGEEREKGEKDDAIFECGKKKDLSVFHPKKKILCGPLNNVQQCVYFGFASSLLQYISMMSWKSHVSTERHGRV